MNATNHFAESPDELLNNLVAAFNRVAQCFVPNHKDYLFSNEDYKDQLSAALNRITYNQQRLDLLIGHATPTLAGEIIGTYSAHEATKDDLSRSLMAAFSDSVKKIIVGTVLPWNGNRVTFDIEHPTKHEKTRLVIRCARLMEALSDISHNYRLMLDNDFSKNADVGEILDYVDREALPELNAIFDGLIAAWRFDSDTIKAKATYENGQGLEHLHEIPADAWAAASVDEAWTQDFDSETGLWRTGSCRPAVV